MAMPSAIAATKGAQPERGQHIVDAAIRLILRDGIDGVRAQALAREAGISIATPYYYFTALDDIVLAAFESADAAASQHRARTIEQAGDDPVAQLRALLVGDFDGSAATVRDRWSLRLEFQRGAIFDAHLRTRTCASERAAVDRLTALLTAARASGDVPSEPEPAALAHRLLSLSCGLGSLILTNTITPQHACDLIVGAIGDRASWRAPSLRSTPPAPLPAQHADDRALEILDATIVVIVRLGVGGVTFRSVATEAETSLALPRYYFPTIPRLLAAAFDRDEQLARERIERSATQLADPLERLRYSYISDDTATLAAHRQSQVVWLEYLRIAQRDLDARAATRARLEAWTAYGMSLGGDLATIGAAPAERIVEAGAQRSVAVITGATGLWLLGVLSDAAYVAAYNGGIDDELGLLP